MQECVKQFAAVSLSMYKHKPSGFHHCQYKKREQNNRTPKSMRNPGVLVVMTFFKDKEILEAVFITALSGKMTG